MVASLLRVSCRRRASRGCHVPGQSGWQLGQRSAGLAVQCRQPARRRSAPGMLSACGKVPPASLLFLPLWSKGR